MRLPYRGGSADSVIDGELSMDDRGDQQIIPGISLSPTGEATVDPALREVLADHVGAIFTKYDGKVGRDD